MQDFERRRGLFGPQPRQGSMAMPAGCLPISNCQGVPCLSSTLLKRMKSTVLGRRQHGGMEESPWWYVTIGYLSVIPAALLGAWLAQKKAPL